jgi:hypothetical protein
MDSTGLDEALLGGERRASAEYGALGDGATASEMDTHSESVVKRNELSTFGGVFLPCIVRSPAAHTPPARCAQRAPRPAACANVCFLQSPGVRVGVCRAGALQTFVAPAARRGAGLPALQPA